MEKQKFTIKIDIHLEYTNIPAASEKEAYEKVENFIKRAHQIDITKEYYNKCLGTCKDPGRERWTSSNLEIRKN